MPIFQCALIVNHKFLNALGCQFVREVTLLRLGGAKTETVV